MSDESSRFRKYIRYFWGAFAAVSAIVILLFILIAKGLLGFMPTFEDLEKTETILASEVISADEKVLGTFFTENRTYVAYENLPPTWSMP